MKDRVLVIGGGGHGKVVVEAIAAEGQFDITGVIDEAAQPGVKLLGYTVFGGEAVLLDTVTRYGVFGVVVAVGDNAQRAAVVERVAKQHPQLSFPTIIHPFSSISSSASIGRGSVLLAGSIINANASVGAFCIVNTAASLDHDSQLGDYAMLNPHCAVAGNVTIEPFALIGMGANVLQKRRIGRNTVIGAGATVVHDIGDNCVAIGTPARVRE